MSVFTVAAAAASRREAVSGKQGGLLVSLKRGVFRKHTKNQYRLRERHNPAGMQEEQEPPVFQTSSIHTLAEKNKNQTKGGFFIHPPLLFCCVHVSYSKYLGVCGLAPPAGEAFPELLLQLLRRDVQVELEGRALVLAGDDDGLKTHTKHTNITTQHQESQSVIGDAVIYR